MRKKFLYLTLVLTLNVMNSNAQNNCGQAISQLQNYVASVNQQYQYWYWQDIPNRCPAYDNFGRPFNPVMVQNCRNQLFYSLSNWYSQQTGYVNNWYLQISRTCSEQPHKRPEPPGPGREIDTEPLQDLEQDIAQTETETKNVILSIPSSPSGWRP